VPSSPIGGDDMIFNFVPMDCGDLDAESDSGYASTHGMDKL